MYDFKGMLGEVLSEGSGKSLFTVTGRIFIGGKPSKQMLQTSLWATSAQAARKQFLDDFVPGLWQNGVLAREDKVAEVTVEEFVKTK